jgi:hypothetical protein
MPTPASSRGIWSPSSAVRTSLALEAVAAAERDKLIIRVLADRGIHVGELVKLRPNDFEERSGQLLPEGVRQGLPRAAGGPRSPAVPTRALPSERQAGWVRPSRLLSRVRLPVPNRS